MKTRIVCKDNKRHTITFNERGALTHCDCEDAEVQAGRLASLIAMGRAPDQKGCAGFVALVQRGIPAILGGPEALGEEVELGGWADLYDRYSANKVFLHFWRAYRRKLEEPYRETLDEARRIIRRLRYYRPDHTAQEREDMTYLQPESNSCKPGALVGAGADDDWTLPLQKGWLNNIARQGIATVEGRFVCGRDPKNPSKLWVVDRDDDGLFAICEKKLPRRRVEAAT